MSSTAQQLSRRQVLAFAVAAAASTAACNGQHSHPRASRGVLRLVSLSPNMTEIVFAVGRGDWLVGRSRFCDYPPRVKAIPQVGGFVDPSMEAILSLTPDLVLGARGPAGKQLEQKLLRHHIDSFFPRTDSVSEIKRAIVAVGSKLRAQKAALQRVHAIEQRLNKVHRAVLGKPSPTVLLVFGHRPLVVCGPGTFPAEMIALAGAVNVVRAGKRYPIVSPETVLRDKPDLIIDATFQTNGATSLLDEPGLAPLKALTSTRIAELHDNTILRPGPRVAQGVARIAAVVHPSLEIPT